ncbi:MAG: hypothetical protein P8K27_02930 [Gammaproteobacteria bacterium]|nr:hypothetical protein [Gammaproteobacteria bacterium]
MSRFSSIFIFLFTSLHANAIPQISGMWLLVGPGNEGAVKLTEKGLRIQSEYDLLVDDPSLSCIPASASRIWANPGSRILITQTQENILISYELFDLRREIPIGDEFDLSELPSTRNTQGSYFSEMGSSFARYDNDKLIIKSENHTLGYIRTSRGIPQSETTETIEEMQIENNMLHVTHTYIDKELYEEPFVLNYFFRKIDETEITPYECTEANYDWFNELNSAE